MPIPSQDRAHFLFLKLHSLTGIFPIGAFLVLHLSVNSLRTVGVWQYQLSIDLINNLPFLIVIETLFIYIPLLIHSLMGFYIIFSGKINLRHYPYPRNWGYTLQRITGAVVFFFLIYHMGTTVGPKLLYGKEQFEAAPFLIDIMNREFSNWTGRFLYLVGIVSATYHFCMGLWSFCVSWGIIIGPAAQRNAGIVFALFGLALTALGVATVAEFSLDPLPVDATVEGGAS
ncbi:MAG: succinate dehydrogenase [Nitrospinaceae bacterium]|nr:MAG: succinate dehydrogenase [Nitrospinaceae bacterium]